MRGEMERTGRKEREYLAHREEIMRAAERVFGAKGFFQTTMNEISAAAEFGTGTLYKYFKSKEDLYFTLIDEKVGEINRLVITELNREGPPGEKIAKTLHLQIDFIERNRDFFRIYTSERNRFEWTVKDDMGAKIHHKMVDYIQTLAQVMEEGIKEGEFKAFNPLDLAHALVGIVNSFLFEWLISPQPYPITLKIDTILEIFFKGVQPTERRQ
jgi:TetR/AcrR family transcriptional regulator